MSEDGSNQISARINQKIAALSKTSNNPFIFKVHHHLRRENKRAYEPEMLSIGPYHYGKNKLQKMEEYKLEYLKRTLKLQNETDSERYIAALMKVEEEARSCYAERFDFRPDAFVEMMLLDGFFIIQFLRIYNMPEEEKLEAPIFSMRLPWLEEVLCRDLLLFENQLPFFILAKLFDMIKIPGQEEDLIHYPYPV